MLSKVFQLNFVDVITVGSIIHDEVAQIRIMFIVEFCDLNVNVFNEPTDYYVISYYGPQGGYFKKSQSKIRGSIFYNFQMIRSRFGIDLKETLIFHIFFAQLFIMYLLRILVIVT